MRLSLADACVGTYTSLNHIPSDQSVRFQMFTPPHGPNTYVPVFKTNYLLRMIAARKTSTGVAYSFAQEPFSLEII